MSGGRKDWSALSSLARQRTLEDEEEQMRERRRRQRNLSSSTDDEAPRLPQNGGRPAPQRLPSVEEAEVSKPPAPREDGKDGQPVLRTRQERRQRRQAVEGVQTPTRERPGPEEADQLPTEPKKDPPVPPRRRLTREQRGPWAGEAGSSARGELGGGHKGVPEKTAAPGEKPGCEDTAVPPGTSPPEKTKPAVGRAAVVAGSQRRRVTERASIFEKSPVPDAKLAPKKAAPSVLPQAQEPLAGDGQPGTPERSARGPPEKGPVPTAERGAPRPQAAASRLPPITLQVKIPSKKEEEAADSFPPPRATYSSSLQRSSPRTISFRMSPRKYSSEAALTRSASVRIPGSTLKFGEKLERYHTAIQRSESIKSPGSSRTEFFVAPVGVASKRHLFERELAGQSRAEAASSRKDNLGLSGVVTSRLNLWISRTQESSEQDPEEVQKDPAASKRTQWGKKASLSLDTEA